MIVILGELGGRDEYGVVEALKAGAITKPVVSDNYTAARAYGTTLSC